MIKYKKNKLIPLFISFFSLAFLGCIPQQKGNTNPKIWSGFLLDDNKRESIYLDKLPSSFIGQTIANTGPETQAFVNTIVVNFYSPYCPPCLQELPALHEIYKKITKKGAKKNNIAMLIAVPQDLTLHKQMLSSQVQSEELESFNQKELIKQLKRDQKKYNIQIPILLLHPKFKIARGELIEATPETVILSRNPLTMHYNFIGPFELTAAENIANPRLHFSIEQITKAAFLSNTLHTQKKQY